MKKIIIIGTIHAGFTPNKELEKVIKKHSPYQILVEIHPQDLKKGKIKSYPPEMQFAASWAKKHNIEVKGFDSKIYPVKKGLTKKQIAEIVKKDLKEAKNKRLSWKKLNKVGNRKELFTETDDLLIDWRKFKARQFVMLRNIKKFMAKKGNIVIITGAGHLDFFEKYLKGATFPLRY